MNRTDGFDRTVSEWLHADAEHRVPEHLDAVLRRTRTEPQRPAWSSLERWLPVQTTLHLAPVPRLAWVLVVLALVVALGAAVLFVGSRPHLPAPFGLARNGAIVYGATDHDIHSMDPLTGASSALVTGVSNDHAPMLSPDGTRFFFLRGTTTLDPTGGFEQMLMIANVDGSDVRPLTGPLPHFVAAVWSNDGSRLAVSSDVDSTPALQVVTVDGSAKPVVIGTPAATAYYLAFRPGDQEITFRGVGASADTLSVVGADGRGLRTIPMAGQGDGASLSPDGTKIAYQTWDGTLGVIHVVDVVTGVDAVPVFAPPADAGSIDDAPTWSPDGTRFLFVRYASGGANNLMVASSTGGHRIEIGPTMSNNGIGGRYQFSPDGSKVLAHYDSDGSTWLLDPTGATSGIRLPSTIAEAATWQRLAP